MNKESNSYNLNLELICVIVRFGMGSKIIKLAKKYGIERGTITLARGTANGHFWDYLGLSDIRKEIVYMVAEKETAYMVLEQINLKYKLNNPNHGIAFTTSICNILENNKAADGMDNERSEEQTMYQEITIIVEKGKAEDVIEAAISAGSKGGTIVNGRGSGIHQTSKLFSMEIEPEKEIVIILSEAQTTDAIVNAIREKMGIDQPGKGIIFVQNVNKTYGIYK